MNIARILATKGSDVITISTEETIRAAISLLARHNIGALVVVNEQNEPIGLISERDIIRRANEDDGVFARTVNDLMTRNVVTGEPQDDLRSVAHTMTEKKFRHLPIVEEGKLIGMVSIRDVVKAERDAYEGEVYTLQTILTGQEAG